jgi:hypothetical protein
MTPLEILRTRYPESAGWVDCYDGPFPDRFAAVSKHPWRVNLDRGGNVYTCNVVTVDPGDGDWTPRGLHSDPDPGIAMTHATERARAALRELLAGAP